jgi:cell division inhibitor SepF
MYRLKAYFGMVPAEEMAEYAEETVADRYGVARRPTRHPEDRWDDRLPEDDEPERERYDEDWDRRPSRSAAADRLREPARVTAAAGKSGMAPSSVGATRGALAIDSDPIREPVRPMAAVATAVPEQRDRVTGGASALSRITTLQPRSYNEARTIGERYRDGVPVIMNLTELDDAAAKRLVDFAAGLIFATRGTIERVTNKVFLLSPPNVSVTAEDKQRIAEGGFFNQS